MLPSSSLFAIAVSSSLLFAPVAIAGPDADDIYRTEFSNNIFLYEVRSSDGTVDTRTYAPTASGQVLSPPQKETRNVVLDAMKLKFPHIKCTLAPRDYSKVVNDESAMRCQGMPPKVDGFLVKCDDNITKCQVVQAPLDDVTLTFNYKIGKDEETGSDRVEFTPDQATSKYAWWGQYLSLFYSTRNQYGLSYNKGQTKPGPIYAVPFKGSGGKPGPLPDLPNPFQVTCKLGTGENLQSFRHCFRSE